VTFAGACDAASEVVDVSASIWAGAGDTVDTARAECDGASAIAADCTAPDFGATTPFGPVKTCVDRDAAAATGNFVCTFKWTDAATADIKANFNCALFK
jgi:hypothetical protein